MGFSEKAQATRDALPRRLYDKRVLEGMLLYAWEYCQKNADRAARLSVDKLFTVGLLGSEPAWQEAQDYEAAAKVLRGCLVKMKRRYE